MTIKENRPLKENGCLNLDDRNYITLGMTYDEFLDLRSLIEELVRSSRPAGGANGNRWVSDFLLVKRDVRIACNLLKRLNKII